MSELRDASLGAEQSGSAGVEEGSFLTEQEERQPETARGLRPSDIRRANRELILALLARDGPTSRVALALRTGLSRVTAGAIVADLLRDGCVREEGSAPSTPAGGRRAILVCLNERVPCIAEDSPHSTTP